VFFIGKKKEQNIYFIKIEPSPEQLDLKGQ